MPVGGDAGVGGVRDTGGRRSWQELGVYLCAVALIALSLLPYATTYSPRGRWQADTNDPADYRYVAEYFWGVPIVPDTYDPIWRGPWGRYLQQIPFRTIGLGSLYLGAGWVRLGHAPRTPDDIQAAGVAFAFAQKVLLALALMAVFTAIRRSWSTWHAFLALVVLSVPTVQWRISDDFITEAVHRILFLFALAAAIALGKRATLRSAAIFIAIWILATQVKVQWYVGALLLLPVMLFQYRRQLTWGGAAALCAATACIPLSVLLVNWSGWGVASLNPGIGFHLNLRYDGAVLRDYSEAMAADPDRPAFATPSLPRLRWWNVYIGDDVSREEYFAFDRFAQAYLRNHPATAARHLAEGLVLGSTLPAVERTTAGRIRIEPLAQPWRFLVRLVDVCVWLLLIVGLRFEETRPASAFALVLWIVPAIGNLVSPPELRYVLPMAGIGFVVALRVVTRLRGRII